MLKELDQIDRKVPCHPRQLYSKPSAKHIFLGNYVIEWRKNFVYRRLLAECRGTTSCHVTIKVMRRRCPKNRLSEKNHQILHTDCLLPKKKLFKPGGFPKTVRRNVARTKDCRQNLYNVWVGSPMVPYKSC